MTAHGDELVVTHDEGTHVSTVVLNRPQAGNSFTWDLAMALQKAIETEGNRAHCVVLASNGRIFCSGVDLRLIRRYASPDRADDLRDQVYTAFQGLIRCIATCPVPVVARVQGPALGLGADLAIACDIRIASSLAWIEESWIKLGTLSALGGGHVLPQLVGVGTALDILLTGRRVQSDEALRIGVFQRVVSSDELDAEVRAVAQQIAGHDPTAVRATKHLVRQADLPRLEQYLDAALRQQVSLITREFFAERVEAVLADIERRTARVAPVPDNGSGN